MAIDLFFNELQFGDFGQRARLRRDDEAILSRALSRVRFLAGEHLNQGDGRGAVPELAQGLGGGAADKSVVVVRSSSTRFDTALRSPILPRARADSARTLGSASVHLVSSDATMPGALKFTEGLDGGEADDRIGSFSASVDVGNLVTAADLAKDADDLFADIAVRIMNVLGQLRQRGNGFATDDRFMGMKSGFAIFGDDRLHERGDGFFVIGAGQRIGGAVADKRVLVVLKAGGDGVDDLGDAVLVIGQRGQRHDGRRADMPVGVVQGGDERRHRRWIVEVRQRTRGGGPDRCAIVPQGFDERGNGSAGSTGAERANDFGPNGSIAGRGSSSINAGSADLSDAWPRSAAVNLRTSGRGSLRPSQEFTMGVMVAQSHERTGGSRADKFHVVTGQMPEGLGAVGFAEFSQEHGHENAHIGALDPRPNRREHPRRGARSAICPG